MDLDQRAKEDARQEVANDAKFYGVYPYFFELRAASSALGGAGTGVDSLLFPLVLAPETISLSEPFAVADTVAQDAGLVVEENGIVRRRLRIEGHTGFKPRPHQISGGFARVQTKFPSYVARGTVSPRALSGQRHFHFLQDKVFRTYGDLKRDPQTAASTSLVWHNIKDDEHWLVAPLEFRMTRSAAKPLLYHYTIELLVVDTADATELAVVGDEVTWLDKIKDVVRSVRAIVDKVIGAVRAVTAAIAEIRAVVASIGNTLRKIGDVIDAVTDFIDGIVDFVTLPATIIKSVANEIESATARLAASARSIDDRVLAAFRRIGDAFDELGQYQSIFAEPASGRLAQINARSQLSTSRSTRDLTAAEADPPTALRDFSTRGSLPLPGSALQARGDRNLGRSAAFSSTRAHTIGPSDTLQSIAARELGDGARWREIALLNNLRPPYISRSGLPGTLQPGEQLAIPTAGPARVRGPISIVGALPTDPIEVQLLGRDLKLEALADGRFTLVTVHRDGYSDAATIEGVSNLVQALTLRTSIERGTDLLYPRLGYSSVIGLGISPVDTETLRLRLSAAVRGDPRIAGTSAVRLRTGDTPDAIRAEIDASVRGLDTSIRLDVAAPRATPLA